MALNPKPLDGCRSLVNRDRALRSNAFPFNVDVRQIRTAVGAGRTLPESVREGAGLYVRNAKELVQRQASLGATGPIQL